MRFPLSTLALLAGLNPATCSEEKPIAKASERSDMARNLILDEAATRGFSGDSIKLYFDAPCSVVMRLYSISNGKPKIVQSSHPTAPSKSFEIGFLFRPAKDGTKTLSFIFYDHERPAKGLGADLKNQEQKPHLITEEFAYSMLSMGSVRTTGESVGYYASSKGPADNNGSVEVLAKVIEAGYVITATIEKHSEHGSGGQPATRPESK